MSQIRLILIMLCLGGQVLAQPHDFNFPGFRAEFDGFHQSGEYGIHDDKVFISYRMFGGDSLIHKLVRIDPSNKEVLVQTVKTFGNNTTIYLGEGGKYWVLSTMILPIQEHHFDIIEAETGKRHSYRTDGYLSRSRLTVTADHLYVLESTSLDWNLGIRGDSLEIKAIRLGDGTSNTLIKTVFPKAMTESMYRISGAFDAERRLFYMLDEFSDTTYVVDSTGYKTPFYSSYAAYLDPSFVYIRNYSLRPEGFELVVFDARLAKDTAYTIRSNSVWVFGPFTNFLSAFIPEHPLSGGFIGQVGGQVKIKLFVIERSGQVADSLSIPFEQDGNASFSRFLSWSGGYAYSYRTFFNPQGRPELHYVFLDSTGQKLNLDKPTNRIELYPNPTIGSLSIKTAALDLSFSLSDAYGRQVYSQKRLDAVDWPLNLSDLSPGVYFLQFYNPDGSTRETREIVLR